MLYTVGKPIPQVISLVKKNGRGFDKCALQGQRIPNEFLEEALYRNCQKEETSKHILCQCESLRRLRFKLMDDENHTAESSLTKNNCKLEFH